MTAEQPPPRRPRPTLLLADHGGHSFTYELAVELSRSLGSCTYAYSAGNIAPHGRLADEAGVHVTAVGPGRFEKYHLLGRLWSELRLGSAYAAALLRARPRVVIAANMPVISVLILWAAAIVLRRRRVLWLQDVQSGLAASGTERPVVARLLGLLEAASILFSSTTIAISDDIAAEAHRLTRGRRRAKVTVVRNWPPLASIPVHPRHNAWSAAHGLDDVTTLLYAGTLARKHNPAILVELARALCGHGALVVVVTEGEGGQYLAEECAADPTLPLRILPYQPFEQLPLMLASADVLLALLQPGAAPYSVPSKTLSYLCAGRPIVAALPPSNLAATIIGTESGGGVVVDPADHRGFIDAACNLIATPQRRAAMGAAGRAYAEREFHPSITTARFAAAAGLIPAVEPPAVVVGAGEWA